MSLFLDLVSAPLEDFDAATPGKVTYRTMNPGWGDRYSELSSLSLDVRAIPSITQLSNRSVRSNLLSGGGRLGRLDREKIGVTLAVDDITPDEFAQLRRLFTARRPVMLSPGFDSSTFWASRFQGTDANGYLAQVGVSETYTPRASGAEYVPSPYSGDDGLISYQGVPKITKGYLGNAIRLDRQEDNLMGAIPTWTISGSGAIENTSFSNSTSPAGHIAYLAVGDAAETTRAGLTASTRYVASLWCCPKGDSDAVVQFQADDGTPTSVNLDMAKGWQRVFVTWVQSGTSLTLRVKNISSTAHVTVAIAGVQVEPGSIPTSYMANTVPTTYDRLRISDTANPALGLSMSFWYRHFLSSWDKCYLASWRQSGTDQYIYHLNGLWYVAMQGSGYVNVSTGGVDGAWVHFAITLEPKAGGYNLVIYEDGAVISSTFIVSSWKLPTFNNGLSIGSDSSLLSPAGASLNSELDSVRIDQKARTDIAAEYSMMTDDGMREFLALVSGRMFEITQIPSAFKAGVLTDSMEGIIKLDQVGYMPAGLSC